MSAVTAARPVDTAPLLAPVHEELVALLRKLPPESWTLPTAAGAWLVRDVAAHLLDVILRRLSLHRDGHWAPDSPGSGYDGLVAFLNGLNRDWVRAASRLSPRV